MATNAFLSWSLGPGYNFTLLGLSEMPKPGEHPSQQLRQSSAIATHRRMTARSYARTTSH